VNYKTNKYEIENNSNRITLQSSVPQSQNASFPSTHESLAGPLRPRPRLSADQAACSSVQSGAMSSSGGGGGQQFRYTQTPSKVLHLRNLPWECAEEELVELCKPFGRIVNTKCGVGANRNQAFVEFVSPFPTPPLPVRPSLPSPDGPRDPIGGWITCTTEHLIKFIRL
jgi:RNA recognition motif-containing protein